ncbi:MAG: ferritin-like domain-containing protein [Candidatus Binatia bacterium]
MSIFHAIFRSWRHLLAAFNVNDRQTLLEILCEAYRAEVNAITQCTQHADQMFYPQFHAKLLRIAAEMQTYLPWLQEQILALGGSLPSFSPTPTRAHNSWECLRRDVEEAQRGCVRLLEWSHRAEREDPKIAVGLQRIRKDKLRHREEFRHMFMKSDPYTIAPTMPRQAHEAGQKQVWLEQRKNEWMDHERAAWEIEGKQTPWAEWSGEQEFKWVTELPHHNREWAQHLAEQREAKMHSTTS